MLDSQNSFGLLRTKNIIAILDGDSHFGEIETSDDRGNITISLPRLSGPNICDISTRFGLPLEYRWSGGSKSRWEYFDDLIKHCINKHKESELLCYLFSKERFVEKLNGYSETTIESAYRTIISTVITQINNILSFGDYELRKIGSRYDIFKRYESVEVATPTVKTIDQAYIVSISERAMKDVSDGNFDSAITKCRTLLEEVFCYVIERKRESPSESGDIGKLYNQVKSLYNMHQNKDMDKRINGLLSGLEKIVNSIAEMRNKGSDSHGVGSKRININSHHARLFVNSAMTMADFILSVSENQS